MLFEAWCICHLFDVRLRLKRYEQERQRRRVLRDWQAEKARLFALVSTRLLSHRVRPDA